MARVVIVPAILTDNAEVMRASLVKYSKFANRLQIDVSDGTMAPTKLVPEAQIPKMPGVTVDAHMMVSNPAQHLDAVIKMKPSMAIFHAEADGDLLPIFAKLKQSGIRTGVAFLKQTYPGSFKQYLEVVDHVLIFAGELGKQGGVADLLQVEKAKIIRSMRKDIELGWDGGATMGNVRTIFQGGIEVINVGGAIANASDPVAEYNALVAEAEKPGVM